MTSDQLNTWLSSAAGDVAKQCFDQEMDFLLNCLAVHEAHQSHQSIKKIQQELHDLKRTVPDLIPGPDHHRSVAHLPPSLRVLPQRERSCAVADPDRKACRVLSLR